jgi:hypothetical protein
VRTCTAGSCATIAGGVALLGSLLVSGCYLGSARNAMNTDLTADEGWELVEGMTAVRQVAREDCGAAALAMVLGYWELPMPRRGEAMNRARTPRQPARAGEFAARRRRIATAGGPQGGGQGSPLQLPMPRRGEAMNRARTPRQPARAGEFAARRRSIATAGGPQGGGQGSPLQIQAARDDIQAANPTPPGRGIRAGALRDFARQQGLQAFLIQGQFEDLDRQLRRHRPVLVGLRKHFQGRTVAHYEVVVGIHRQQQRILTLDPAHGLRVNSREGFAAEWAAAGQVTLIIFPRTSENPR